MSIPTYNEIRLTPQNNSVALTALLDGDVVYSETLTSADYTASVRSNAPGDESIYIMHVPTRKIVFTFPVTAITRPEPAKWKSDVRVLVLLLSADPYFNELTTRTTQGWTPERDAAGLVRVSEPRTLFDNKFTDQIDPAFWDFLLNGGAIVAQSPLTSAVTLTVPAVAGARAVLQTKEYFIYQPGKSFRFKLTGVLHSAINAGLTVRWGYFDDANDVPSLANKPHGGNGIFIEYSGGQYWYVIRSSTSGTQVDTRVARANWNIDSFNGRGANGENVIDFTKTQLFDFDFLWQGVGDVRCGLFVNNIPMLAHQFHNGNDITAPYMSTANLPLRFEIINVNGAASASTTVVCQEIISEGGYDPRGYTTVWPRLGVGGVANMSTNSNEYHIATFRYNPSRVRNLSKPFAVLANCTTAANIGINLWLNMELTGLVGLPAFSPVDPQSNLEVAAASIDLGATPGAATRLANARLLDRLEFTSLANAGVAQGLEERVKMGASIAGVSDTITLTAYKLDGIISGLTETVRASIKWTEFN